MHDSKIIQFRGRPLFQKAKFISSEIMQGALKEFACFFYMVQGSMYSYDHRGQHRVDEKDAILKNCGNYVQHYVNNRESEECEAIAIYFYPELLQEIYKDDIPSFLTDIKPKSPRKLLSNRLIEQYMNNLIIFFEEPEAFDEDLGILKLRELMMILLKSEKQDDVRQFLSEVFNPADIEFNTSIESNLYNPLSVEQLAFICNMSLSSFQRKFRKLYQSSPAKYIKHRRLEKAANMLTCMSEPVAHIAYDCGFQDVTTFSSNFKEKYHISPSQYRLNEKTK